MSFFDAARRFLSFDTRTADGVNETKIFLDEMFEGSAYSVDWIASPLENQRSKDMVSSERAYVGLMIHRKEHTGIDLLFFNRLETPDPGSFAKWAVTNGNPFQATISDGQFFGLGVNHSKLDLFLRCWVLRTKNQLGNKSTACMAMLPFFSNAGSLVRTIRQLGVKPKGVIVGEPTGLGLGVAALGHATVEILIPFTNAEKSAREKHNEVTTASSQSKTFFTTVESSAVRKLLDFVVHLPKGVMILDSSGGESWEQASSAAFVEFDLFGDLTETSVGKLQKIFECIREIESDSMTKMKYVGIRDEANFDYTSFRCLPEGLLVSGSCRLSPEVSEAVYQSWLDILRTRTSELECQFRILELVHPFRLDSQSALLKLTTAAMEKLVRAPAVIHLSRGSAANVFARLGVPSLVFGPGTMSGASPIADEAIKMEGIETALSFYGNLIEDL